MFFGLSLNPGESVSYRHPTRYLHVTRAALTHDASPHGSLTLYCRVEGGPTCALGTLSVESRVYHIPLSHLFYPGQAVEFFATCGRIQQPFRLQRGQVHLTGFYEEEGIDEWAPRQRPRVGDEDLPYGDLEETSDDDMPLEDLEESGEDDEGDEWEEEILRDH